MKKLTRIFAGTLAALLTVIGISQIPISQLPPATLPLTGTEQVPMVQNNKTVQAPANKVGTPLTSFTQITSLWTPPCNAANLFLSGNGTCSNPSTPPGGATGNVQYNNGGAFGGSSNLQETTNQTTLTITQNLNTFAALNVIGIGGGGNSVLAEVQGVSAGNTGTDYGLVVAAGTTNTDFALEVTGQGAGTPTFLNLRGDGSGFIGPNSTNDLSWTNHGAFTVAADQTGNGPSLIVQGSPNAFAELVTANSTAGQALGLQIQGGSNSSDSALFVQNQAGGQNFLDLIGDGSGFIGTGTSGPGMFWNSARNFTIADTSGNAELTITGHANTFGELIQSSAAAGHQEGLLIETGSTAADQQIVIQSTAGPQEFLTFGDGHGYLGPDNTPHGGLSWTNLGAFSVLAPNGAGPALQVTAASGNQSLTVNAPNSAGNSFGLLVDAGTTSGDSAVQVRNAANSLTFMNIWGDGHGNLGPSTSTGLSWTSVGNVTVQPPASGTGISLLSTSIAGGIAAEFTQAGATGNVLVLNETGAGTNGSIQQFFDNSGDFEIENFTGGSSTFIGNQGSGGLVCLIQNTICQLTVASNGGVEVANGTSVPGGSQGAGTVNISGGYYENGIAGGTAITANTASISNTETYVSAPLSIPANALQVGEIFIVECYGQLTTTVSNLLNFNLRLGANGTTTDTLLNGSLPISAGTTNNTVVIRFTVVVRAIGSSGTIAVNTLFAGASGNAGTAPINTGTTTINTTGALKLGMSFVSANTTSAIVFSQATIQRVN